MQKRIKRLANNWFGKFIIVFVLKTGKLLSNQ